ncbi:MAG: DUF433 domain-containing protein, partial [Chloroflexi bacterium]|nr:DUF433 domain-containing protein [Chloroflexota bacterium]
QTVAATDAEGSRQVGYTFDAVVYLRILRMLRDKGVSLLPAVETAKHLRDRFGPPGPAWADVRIFMQGPDVFVDRPDAWQVTASTRKGQKAAVEIMGQEFARLRERADALLVPDRFQSYVEVDPGLRSGLPVLRGTTIQTAVIQGLRERGASYNRIREHYPHLEINQIKKAIQFERFLDAEAA